jgi:hypothetical protein
MATIWNAIEKSTVRSAVNVRRKMKMQLLKTYKDIKFGRLRTLNSKAIILTKQVFLIDASNFGLANLPVWRSTWSTPYSSLF